jgi:hypothetical protein
VQGHSPDERKIVAGKKMSTTKYLRRPRPVVSVLLHDHGRADLDPFVEVNNVLIGQADAAR